MGASPHVPLINFPCTYEELLAISHRQLVKSVLISKTDIELAVKFANTAAKFPRYIAMQHFNSCFERKWAITIDTLVSRYYIAQGSYELDFESDSDSEKEIYFRGRETATARNLHPQCDILRQFV